MRTRAVVSIVLAALVLTCRGQHERVVAKRAAQPSARRSEEDDGNLPSRDAYAGADACRDCHQEKFERWSKDWHARALSPAEPQYIVGDFANAHYRGASSEAWMQKRGDAFVMRTKGPGGKVAAFPVKYVVGGKRMQDTVTEFPDGRMQVLPVYFHVTGRGAWVDYNEKKQGVVTEEHPFYWTNFRRTANHECFECHTTGLDVRYDRNTHQWSTSYSDAGVACESCHGPAARHAETKAKTDVIHPGHVDKKIALEICGSCHGPRDPIYPKFDRAHRYNAGDRYDDKFQPLVIVDGNQRSGEYFADGRPSSSSFEYQALLQSRCLLKGGATCLSCHTAPHQDHGVNELKPAAHAGCESCHASVVAQREQHSHHKNVSCESCHMPNVVTGVLDKFADHTIDIPNPVVTAEHDVPNACGECHEKKSPNELQATMRAWWPDIDRRQARRVRLANAIDEKTATASLPSLRAVIEDRGESNILRGACALLLGQRFPRAAAETLAPLLDDPDPLVRANFIEGLGHAHAMSAANDVAQHVEDSSVQVRQMAAMVLTSFNDPRGVAALQKLANDPATTTLVRPHMMLASQFARRGELDAAKAELQKVLAVMPYVPDALVMLADVDVRQGHRDEARASLEEALRFNPSHEGAKRRLAMMSE